jgi:transketolase
MSTGAVPSRRESPLTVERRRRLCDLARRIRVSILESIHAGGSGHAGSSLSIVDVLAYLYSSFLRVDPQRPHWPERDWMVFSKGHGAPALYATLAHAGYFDTGELATLRALGSRLQGHPRAGTLPGIDVSTGSLGQGLSIAVGLALSFRLRGSSNRVVCVLGDGELQEGQNWEAMMAAASLNLRGLIAIVDRNRLQNDGATEHIIKLEDLAAKATAFGWASRTLNGHDFDEIAEALDAAAASDRPTFLVAETIKGRGVSFMEGVVHWHHHPLDAADLARALADVDRPGD